MIPMNHQEDDHIGVPLSHLSRTISVSIAPVKSVPESIVSYQIYVVSSVMIFPSIRDHEPDRETRAYILIPERGISYRTLSEKPEPPISQRISLSPRISGRWSSMRERDQRDVVYRHTIFWHSRHTWVAVMRAPSSMRTPRHILYPSLCEISMIRCVGSSLVGVIHPERRLRGIRRKKEIYFILMYTIEKIPISVKWKD